MLAEPRRRQKFSVDPRGLAWSNDNNKIGQRMLEKMGWKKGKGLGANLNGNPDHISVALKSEKYGFGFSKKDADNWIAHQDEFNTLLAQLNAENQGVDSSEEGTKVQSLELKSKEARSRVHYKKFTKGKDLSNYGSEDMDCIFGKRKSKSKNSTPEIQSEANSEANSDTDTVQSALGTEENPEKSFGIQTITSSSNLYEYFAQKQAKLQKEQAAASVNCGSASPVSEVTQGTAESEDLEYNQQEEHKRKKKKKKDKKKMKFDAEVEEVHKNSNSVEEMDVCKKSKDKKRKYVEELPEKSEDVEMQVPKKSKDNKHENCCESSGDMHNADSLFTSSQVVEESDSIHKSRKKKSKKKKRNKEMSSDPYISEGHNLIQASEEAGPPKKKKRQEYNEEDRKDTTGENNVHKSDFVTSENCEDVHLEELPDKKEYNEEHNETFNIENDLHEEEKCKNGPDGNKRNKKKKKDKISNREHETRGIKVASESKELAKFFQGSSLDTVKGYGLR